MGTSGRQYGEISAAAGESSPASVLFVCSANRCRSPMAAGIFRSLLGDETDWLVGSAGTWATEGLPVVPEVLQVMSRRGIDLSHHRARRVSEKLLAASHLILVMEASHQEAILTEFPQTGSRVFLLSEMSSHWQPIIDPIGGAMKDYEHALNELEWQISQGLDRIRYLARLEQPG